MQCKSTLGEVKKKKLFMSIRNLKTQANNSITPTDNYLNEINTTVIGSIMKRN